MWKPHLKQKDDKKQVKRLTFTFKNLFKNKTPKNPEDEISEEELKEALEYEKNERKKIKQEKKDFKIQEKQDRLHEKQEYKKMRQQSKEEKRIKKENLRNND